MRLLTSLWSKYTHLLEVRPFLTRTITTGVVLGLGDAGAQLLTNNYKNYDPKRSAKMAIIGATLIGPHVYGWFKFLEYMIPGSAAGRVITKVVIDQLFWCPYMISLNFAAVGLWNGRTIDQIIDMLKVNLFPAQVRAWCFWPFIHYMTFGPMPHKFRMLWSNSMSVVWNAYLSSVANKPHQTSDQSPDLILDPTPSIILNQPTIILSPQSAPLEPSVAVDIVPIQVQE